MKKWIYVMLALSIAGIGGFSVHAASSSHEKHLNISRMNVDDEFKDTDGTFILHDMQKDKTFVYNRERANKRQTPSPPLRS
ncbi:putative beta-lactamase ybxI precursor [Bacillus subtilis]|nr:putative beta-lactamase ybxI precursor [Bacillus subtilis]RPK22268.1 putative beta-lactamase ybxI precursor [Bacillus subtilis]